MLESVLFGAKFTYESWWVGFLKLHTAYAMPWRRKPCTTGCPAGGGGTIQLNDVIYGEGLDLNRPGIPGIY